MRLILKRQSKLYPKWFIMNWTYNATYAFGLILTVFIKNVEISVYHINIYRVFYRNFKSNLHFFIFFWRLPLPWILWNAVNWREDGLGVSSKGAACSISMLFIMLILVFLSILAFKWKMTKAMGAVMLVLYVIFVVISLGFSFGWYTCPNIGGG